MGVGLLALRAASKHNKSRWTYGEPGCPGMCNLPCDSGSCNNWLVWASSMADCNDLSQKMGCGDCKASIPAGIEPYAESYGGNYATLCPPGAQPAYSRIGDGTGIYAY